MALGEQEAVAVALEHLDPREQMVTEGDRLCALEVREPRHRRFSLALGAVEDGRGERVDRSEPFLAGSRDVEPKGCRHLIVARAARVDLAANLAEQPLDRRVDVLVLVARRRNALLRDPLEGDVDLVELRVGEDTGAAQPFCVDAGALAVVGKQLGVRRFQEALDLCRERGIACSA